MNIRFYPKFSFLLFLILFSSCAELKKFQTRVIGRDVVSNFNKIIVGMTHDEVLKIGELPILESLKISSNKILYKFEDGFTVEEKNVVKETYIYKEIEASDTINNLVALGMDVVQVIRGAGWPPSIKQNGAAHVFYYRTGTLLLKDFELVNSFNRNEEYNVIVSAYKGFEVKNPVYYIVPSVTGIERNSLEFIEVKNYVTHTVALSNGKVTEKLSDANTILFVNFGVGNKEVDILTYSTPVYNSVYNPGTTTTTRVQNNYGKNVGSFQTTSLGSYSSQYAGNSTSSIKVEKFRRHLILEAIHAAPFKTNGEKKYFWKVTTESTGRSDDYRAILPVLAYATNGYLFKNTGKAVETRIDFDQMMTFFLEIFSK